MTPEKEQKLREAAIFFIKKYLVEHLNYKPEQAIAQEKDVDTILNFAKSTEVAEYHKAEVSMEKLHNQYKKLYGTMSVIPPKLREEIWSLISPHLQKPAKSEPSTNQKTFDQSLEE